MTTLAVAVTGRGIVGVHEPVIAADDEAYTYNKRINRLATVQEHFMVVRAIERVAAQMALADLPLKAFLNADLVPYEED